jgi:GDP-D-mannose 3',5'-epimerase
LSKVIVTGGAGFLGSNIVARLVDQGREVSIVDDLSGGSLANLADVGVGRKPIVGDLRSYEFAKRALKGADTVFHFAAEVGSVTYLHGSNASELAAMEANLVIDANVFRACLENGVKTVVYASSVSVYPIDEQQGSNVSFKEEDSDRKVNPEGGYGWSKYIAEKQLELMPGVAYGSARIFHSYGRNIYLRPDRSQVIASLIRKSVRYPKEPFDVWGDGTQRRCFVYIDDTLEALMALERHVVSKGSLKVNIGSTEETTVADLAKKVIRLSGKDIPLKFDKSKPTGALNRKPDLERAKRVIGWEPRTPFATGLKKTYEWAEERLGRAA